MLKRLIIFICSSFLLQASQMSEHLVQRQQKTINPLLINPLLNEAMWEYVENNKVQELAQLLNGSAIPQIDSSRYGMTPLLDALFHSRYDIAQLLIEHGANPHIKSLGNHTALMYAVSNPDIMKSLIAQGVALDEQDGGGMTALMMAALDRDYESVKTLVDAGAAVDIRDNQGKTALIWSTAIWSTSENARPEIIQLLIDAGANIGASSQDGETALSQAIWYRFLNSARALLRAGADPFSGRAMGYAFADAIKGYPQTLELLIMEGVDPEEILKFAASTHQAGQIEPLVEQFKKERLQWLAQTEKAIAASCGMIPELSQITAEYSAYKPHEMRKRKAPEPSEEDDEEKTIAETEETQQAPKKQKTV